MTPTDKAQLAQRLELFLFRELLWALHDAHETDPDMTIGEWLSAPNRLDLVERLLRAHPAIYSDLSSRPETSDFANESH
jgi:hypothetical protein